MIPRAIYQCIIHNTIGRIGQCSCSASIRDAIPDTSIAFTISYLSHLLYTSNCYACLHVYIGHIEEEIITSHGSGIVQVLLPLGCTRHSRFKRIVGPTLLLLLLNEVQRDRVDTMPLVRWFV